MSIPTPVPVKYTVALKAQGAVQMPAAPNGPLAASVAIAGLAGCSLSCASSLANGWASCSYDQVNGIINFLGIPGDTIVWSAYTLTVSP